MLDSDESVNDLALDLTNFEIEGYEIAAIRNHGNLFTIFLTDNKLGVPTGKGASLF